MHQERDAAVALGEEEARLRKNVESVDEELARATEVRLQAQLSCCTCHIACICVHEASAH
jgi:hypothetical protein